MTWSRPTRSRARGVVALAGAGLLLGSLPALASATAGAAPAAAPVRAADAPYELKNGRTAPIYGYAGAIRETVYVLADDFDGNGQPDRVAVDVVRPAETERAGQQVPVIMDASPYYLSIGRGNEAEKKTYDADGNPALTPLFYDNYFVPRGYAFVAVDLAGTARSTGCVDEGGVSDVGSAAAAVDWLNGNAEAVDADGEPVVADWTNGKTGMIGKSYDGTIANGVAALGTEGLETIVPISAISSWYDYTRSQKLPYSWDYAEGLSRRVAADRTETVDCEATYERLSAEDDDETGRYNAFWAERDHRNGTTTKASNVTASVFVMHGLQDLNVKTRHFSKWWTQLGKNGVTRKMWLTRLGHVDAFDSDRTRWIKTLHRWFDSQLMGIDNGILDEPAVDIETQPNEWTTAEQWPTGERTVLRPTAGGTLAATGAQSGTASWLNAPNQTETTALTAGSEANRLLYASAPLGEDTRISGETVAKLRITSEVETGQVGVMLVDYGLDERVLATGDGARTTEEQSCHGRSTSYDDACYYRMTRNLGQTPFGVLGRGWARLDGARTRDVTVRLDPDDAVVEAGHRLGVVLVGAAPSRVRNVDTSPTSRYTIDLARTSFTVPGDLALGGGAGSRSQGPAAWLPAPSDVVPGTVAEPTPRFQLPR
ncbi:CocE/NonD family hydrolase [Nocardioides sp. CFH 31398]|uniref:CocE/NonD family hydrolase n=1 Tax=Nocardioides sp. CFH 31398 TaxID=2919579 RepID=UPI001F06AA56|nr:CocE/NonD family hydrolase [Nocardioides sp. CFH 31398]MCH1865452.1 CocE/NonD family hydrolase [Nocardioides sp. CFH 31398]